MRVSVWKCVRLFCWCCVLITTSSGQAPQARVKPNQGYVPAVPKMWNDQAMSTLEVTSPNPAGIPKHPSAEYYYNIPVRPIYKSYPVYAPGHEPGRL